MSFILFLIILAILIFVHELGHFLVAKLAKIRVDEFALGFPPTLASKKYGETTYKLNIIPFGGYVSIFGENPDEESLNGPDANRSMSKKNRAVQAAVLLAGVTFNIIFAWILISATLMLGISSTASFGGVDTEGKVVINQVMEDSPAQAAGVQLGDVIVSIAKDGVVLTDADPSIEEVQRTIGEESEGEELVLSVIRGAETVELSVVPIASSAGGAPVIGISMDSGEIIKSPWYSAPLQGAEVTWRATILTAQGLFVFLGAAFQGQADFDQVSGPVGIVNLVGDASSSGIAYILFFTALISINLAVINVLPFPALDGGRLLFIFIESIIRRPISPKVQNTFNAVGFTLLILLMVVVTFSDVMKLFFR